MITQPAVFVSERLMAQLLAWGWTCRRAWLDDGPGSLAAPYFIVREPSTNLSFTLKDNDGVPEPSAAMWDRYRQIDADLGRSLAEAAARARTVLLDGKPTSVTQAIRASTSSREVAWTLHLRWKRKRAIYPKFVDSDIMDEIRNDPFGMNEPMTKRDPSTGRTLGGVTLESCGG